MHIGLINPNKNLKNPAVHLGLGYIASFARIKHDDLTFSLLDTRVASAKEISDFYNQRFDLLGITSSSQTFLEAVEIAESFNASYPEMPICIGGSHASTVKEEALENFPFDYAVIGEGEITFSQLISHLKGEKSLNEIEGLVYKSEDGTIITNQARKIIDDIDQLPIPAYELFRNERYPQHRLTTSRGCPFDCVFCNSSTIWSRKWRMRSPEKIVEEIQYLIRNFKMKTFVFNDDSFNINKTRVIEFCKLLIELKTNILWSVPIRVDLITDEIAGLMKKAGCYSVSIGIESANNDVLRQINKNNTKEKIYSGIQVLRAAGIDVLGQFMIGNPGDTLETIKESIEFAKSSNLSNVEFYTALPYKGSLLWEYAHNEGTMLTDVETYHYHEINPRIIFETPEFSQADRIKAIGLAIENKFYDALENDKKTLILDIGKHFAKMLQHIFAGNIGNKIYLRLRNIYRKLS